MIISQNIPLKKYSNFNIGGNASYFYEVDSKDDLVSALLQWQDMGGETNNIFILGSGTNILFSDDGFDGLVIKDNIKFIKRKANIVNVGGGTLISDLVNFCMQSSLSGFEWAGGLPGTVGGAIRGNAGAFLGDTSGNVGEVESIDVDKRKIKTRNKDQCKFGYRRSVFKQGVGKKEIILSAKFKLRKGDRELIKSKTQERVDYRIDRHPLDFPNIGSTFKNVPLRQASQKVQKEFSSSIKPDPFPVIPAAKLLIGAGLKGKVIGGAMFSEKHPNFIVNFKNAKAQDVLALISFAKKEIKEKYNIDLEEEITIVPASHASA